MQVYDGDGTLLDAEYSVVPHGGHLDLILESSGGAGANRAARNTDYRAALGLLLERLSYLDATLEDAVVDSRYTQQAGIRAADRRLIDDPVRLADVENLTLLRGQLNARQTRIGQAEGAIGGNSTKRIRLQLTVPGFGPGDADRLAGHIAGPVPALGPVPAEAMVIDGSHRMAGLAALRQPQQTPIGTIGEVLEALRGLRLQYGLDDRAKRHQPLTLLWAIGRARQGQPRLIPWPVARTKIRSLIEDYGRPTDRPNPDRPFLALAASGLWELTVNPPTGLAGGARRRWLNNANPVVRGGLTSPVYDLMAASEDAAAQAVGELLADHFDSEDWDGVLTAVGLANLAGRLHSSLGEHFYWWSSLPSERSWVEIRRASQGLGQELRCPFVNAVGRRDGWWELIDGVQIGDRIYHWNADQGRFVGRSYAATTRQVDTTTGERVVRLRDFLPLVVDVGLEQVRALAPQLEAERDAITEEHPGSTLYLPFQFRSDGLRLMSNYFAKLPLAMQQALFGSDGLAQSDLPAPNSEDGDDGEAQGGEEAGRPGGFLSPFKPRADADYVSNIAGGPVRRSRKHETLVNDFARWLSERGREAASNAAIDLGIVHPPVIIEAKVIRAGKWATSIREAIGQLYEYKYFQLVAPESELLFLASVEIPQKWLDYLDKDRQIGAIWRAANGFEMTARARAALGVEM